MAFISAFACSKVTSGLIRAATVMNRPCRVRISFVITQGDHISAVLAVFEPFFMCHLNPAGITPMTVASARLMFSVRPMIFGSPPKRRCHRP